MCGRGGRTTTPSRAGLLGVSGDLLFDAGGGFGNSLNIAGELMDGKNEAECVSIMVELIGFFKGLDGRFNLAEFFFCLGEGDIASG